LDFESNVGSTREKGRFRAGETLTPRRYRRFDNQFGILRAKENLDERNEEEYKAAGGLYGAQAFYFSKDEHGQG
jgi:hypothetical protein